MVMMMMMMAVMIMMGRRRTILCIPSGSIDIVSLLVI